MSHKCLDSASLHRGYARHAEGVACHGAAMRRQCRMTIAKVVRKTTVRTANDDARDLAYWLSRPVHERLAAVEELRRPVMEALPIAEQRLQRVYRVTTLKRG